jgi:hypothetical protein
MEDYISLDRRFVEFDPKVERERDNYSFAIASLFSGAEGWQRILEQPCTVIVAEAGNGKTAELRHQTIVLRKEGKAVFSAISDSWHQRRWVRHWRSVPRKNCRLGRKVPLTATSFWMRLTKRSWPIHLIFSVQL